MVEVIEASFKNKPFTGRDEGFNGRNSRFIRRRMENPSDHTWEFFSQNLLSRQGQQPVLQGQGHHPAGVSASTVRSASLTPLAAAVAAAGSNGGRVLSNEYNTGSNNSTPR